ncbi:MAG: TatD family hydrolase [Burkholderiaceae bacterium]
MLIDTHCHFDAPEFDPDWGEALMRAQAAGVQAVIMPAVRREHFAGLRRLAAAHGGLCYALGIHPMCVETSPEQDLDLLRQAVIEAMDDPRFVAIGEIGLDHFVPGLDRQRQEHFLIAQLRLAREFDLPVLLHVRKAQDAVLKQLRRMGIRQGIAHAFNGSLQQAGQFSAQGLVLGFGGAMTWSRALQIRRLAAGLDASALVLETDAPDIPPVWRAGQRNEPAELAGIAQCLAELRGSTLESIARQTAMNACRVLPRLGPWLDSSRLRPPT